MVLVYAAVAYAAVSVAVTACGFSATSGGCGRFESCVWSPVGSLDEKERIDVRNDMAKRRRKEKCFSN